ncbi:MAG: hypothetical protein AAGU21_10855 [Solidesulfovibrio sp.]|uniref:hypothetical protein n=1 Tax=Solidesulfovibrio sp. TaxID=2910990 RepID=UPI002B204640|nr:hypothetical protein [Solidesulfovibrio sp.]MEA4858528.1 hypothetical protein [Solidesulfovibrio sp.]
MTGGRAANVAEEIAALDVELAELAEKKAIVEKRVRELMAAEDLRAGVFHAQEIFAAKQEKLTLVTQLEIVRRRRERLLAGQ